MVIFSSGDLRKLLRNGYHYLLPNTYGSRGPETSSCWPGQSSELPSPGQHVAMGPSKDGPTPLLCSEPREGLKTALLCAMGQQLLHDSRPSGFCPVSSCISRISQERAERSRFQVNLRSCQERVLFPPPLIDLVLFVLLLFI